jgi:spermidine synthase
MLSSVSAAPQTLVTPRTLRGACYWLFAASGLAGLIYESVWTHYLKLVLGHAAYAQTLVLAIFMGGMAAGAWLAGRWQAAMREPLRAYALVEGVIALCALGFHPVFELSTRWLLDTAPVQLEQPLLVALSKWFLCGGLILPQAVLLGMTFPLMSVGVMRTNPGASGGVLATLYFSNSFGAVIGVLTSAFVLIPSLGLPGTLRIAGVINALLALSIGALARSAEPGPALAAELPGTTPSAPAQDLKRWFLAAALLTGLASFCYEIAWVRMLSLVLGSSVHAFELMLSAFICGLAIGSWLVRRQIDRVADPARLSGYVQIGMGLLALSTLWLYGSTFDVMAQLMAALPKTQRGYSLFNLGSASLALAVMLPTTLVAGMTLPLFTHVLIRAGNSERSVGSVYSANTLGAIAGVLLAVHLVMPALGVKAVVVFGAAVDVGLGLALLRFCTQQRRRAQLALAACASAIFVLALTTAKLDATRMAAGVFRSGKAQVGSDVDVIFHRDGKTASVDVTRARSGAIQIATNGKPDASADPSAKYGLPDEVTMVAIGALALAHVPDARRVANIGFGSGITTHTILGSSKIARVDTVEIEPAMVEGARAFGKLSERAFHDPRSHVHIEDAKTFLSSQREPYDVIASEPSNPWVSGVASLFSREFYRDVKRHIRSGGVLVQWSQLYETDLDNLASVFKALGEHFRDYVVYCTNDLDIVIVAAPDRRLEPANPWVFTEPRVAAQLSRVGIRDLSDIEARRLGDRASLEPLFLLSSAPANSDFFPYLSYRAPATRFMGKRVELPALLRSSNPVLEMLDERPLAASQPWTETPYFIVTGIQRLARWVHADVTGGAYPEPTPRVPPKLRAMLRSLAPVADGCEQTAQAEPQQHAVLHQLASMTTSLLTAQQASQIWQRTAASRCFDRHSEGFRAWFALYASSAARDAAGMQRNAEHALRLSGEGLPREYLEYALTAGTLGALRAQGAAAALDFYASARRGYLIDEQSPLDLRLVLSTAAHGAGRLTPAD